MPKWRIKRDDVVIVTAGKNKGTVGRVLKIHTADGRVVVEGANRVKRHMKPVGDRPGGIVEKEAPIHISNVALWDAEAGQKIKVGYQTIDGRKVRVNRKTGSPIDQA